MTFAKAVALASVSLVAAATVTAVPALELAPGQWEFTLTSQMSIVPDPIVHTSTECITDGNRSADEFLTGMKHCQVTDLVDTGTEMSYKISCPDGPMTMNGSANMKTNGKTVSGDMSMSTSIHGKEMTMRMRWAGKRLGTCNDD